MTTDLHTQATEMNEKLQGTMIFVTAGKRALKWFKTYDGTKDSGYQISKNEALAYL